MQTVDIDSLTEEQIYRRSYLYVLEDETLCRLYMEDVERNLQKIMQQIPEKTLRIFRMSRQKGMKNAEIAKEEGVSVKSVEYHLKKTMQIIRENLSDSYGIIPLVYIYFL